MMRYLPTAFANLHFAWKLYHYGLDGNIDLDKLDIPLRFEEANMVFALPEEIFGTSDDFILALENNLVIAFGAAAITLNRTLEESKIQRPDPIESENDQCIAVIYQIRNAFAHDIAEPRWKINGRYRRSYSFGGHKIDLSGLDGRRFRYEHIGGPEALGSIRSFAEREILGH
ncbi:MAG: hypothetical protein P8P99_03530 [Maricaulis sp.]|nr:hypothetical protein [Maricaulis sp.]